MTHKPRPRITQEEHEATMAELKAMPSVQRVKAAAAALSEAFLELGYRHVESLTLKEVEHLAHTALFAKEKPTRFQRPQE